MVDIVSGAARTYGAASIDSLEDFCSHSREDVGAGGCPTSLSPCLHCLDLWGRMSGLVDAPLHSPLAFTVLTCGESHPREPSSPFPGLLCSA